MIFRLFLILSLSFNLITLPFPYQQQAEEEIYGHWVGTITQQNGPIGDTFEFEMHIYKDGDAIKGTSYEKAGDYFVKMEFKGIVKSNVLVLFEDSKITEHQTPKGINWCIKKGQLILKRNKEGLKLEGFWQGKTGFGACSPGEIYLKKIEPRA